MILSIGFFRFSFFFLFFRFFHEGTRIKERYDETSSFS